MKAFLGRFVALLFLVVAGSVGAQAYPDKPIRIIVPYPPGGGTDTLTRLVGTLLGNAMKQPIVIENRPGGNAQIGMDVVTKAPADGYTLLAIAAGPLNDDNLKSFTPIALFAAPSYMLVVHPSVKAQNVKELVALAKSQPGKLAYGSTGGGAASHLSMELFKSLSGTDMLHTPYKGIGQAMGDLIGGHVQVMIAPPQAVMAQVKAGSLRALGVTGVKRTPIMPDVPTIDEAGVPGYESLGWFGLIAPAGVPRDVITRLNVEINRILQLPEVKERLLELGAEPASMTPDEFLAFIRRDNAKWARLIKERGIVIEGAK
jgi:tripartite-type tricarboxylate transporter receptor subunit TctC